MDQSCTKETEFRWPCSCRPCCREAARAWMGYMDRVKEGDLQLDEANRLADTDPSVAGPS